MLETEHGEAGGLSHGSPSACRHVEQGLSAQCDLDACCLGSKGGEMER